MEDEKGSGFLGGSLRLKLVNDCSFIYSSNTFLVFSVQAQIWLISVDYLMYIDVLSSPDPDSEGLIPDHEDSFDR